MNTRANGTTTEAQRSHKGADGVFTFDDIEIGMRVIHREVGGTVIRKGTDIVGNSNTRHVEIHLDEKVNNSRTKQIHEKTVNRYLKKQRVLWVDWDSIKKQR